MTTILRPLSTSELLDRAFHLYKNNFVLFFGIAAIPQMVVLAAQLVLSRLILSSTPTDLGWWSFPLSFFSLIFVELSEAATVIAVSNLHLERPVHISEAFFAIRGSLGRVVWISFAVGWIIAFGFALLIVPGILWALKYALVIPVTVVEGTTLSESMSRSRDLTEYRRGRIFAVYALLTLLTSVVSSCFDFAFDLGAPWHVQARFTAAQYALTAVSNFLSSSLAAPLLTIALTLIYYDERVRKEGFDLQLMMASLQPGSQAAQAAPAS